MNICLAEIFSNIKQKGSDFKFISQNSVFVLHLWGSPHGKGDFVPVGNLL